MTHKNSLEESRLFFALLRGLFYTGNKSFSINLPIWGITMFDAILPFLVSGLTDASWWQVLLATIVMTHITIAAVTIFLHRCQAHGALELGTVPVHFFRFWLWLTTGMVTKEWVAIHRKHHARCETADDPHSPVTRGIKTVFLRGSELYRAEAKIQETLDRYGHNTPDDWIERHLYSHYSWQGVGVMLVIDTLLFGAVGVTVWAVQMLWIPVMAAGVINGFGHYFGYRNFEVPDASTNIVPWGIVIGGEELHNNHHTYPTSAKFSARPWECDIGWGYIWMLESLGLARVKHIAPKIEIDPLRYECVATNLHEVIALRYEVAAQFACVARQWYMTESSRRVFWQLQTSLERIWTDTKASTEELGVALQNWCHDAKRCGIPGLEELGRALPGYRVKRRV